MLNISKTANRRAKRTKIWDLGSYSGHMQDTLDARFIEFGLVSFGALWKISVSTIFEKLLLQQVSSDFN